MEFFSLEFWQSFVSNALATFIGAGLGVLGALWVSNYQERKSEEERKKKILKQLFNELVLNLTHLSGFQKSQTRYKEALVLSALLRNESWKAFSDGGELEWIKDPSLLYNISEAYYAIRSVMSLSDKYCQVSMLETNPMSFWTSSNLASTIEYGVQYAIESLDLAFKEIKKHTEN
ncbi:MAG: hypothetical protein HZB19_05340 [Chloroflexi bacterium]|nr:hypothetical protein [Chloroflexota bacterium]